MANHHYVPVFYLKKFCDVNTPQGQEPYLWTAPRSGGGWERRAPKNVGYEPDLYSVTAPGGERSDAIEQALSKIEDGVAKLYHDRLDRYEMPDTDQERAMLAQFVAVFVARSPAMRLRVTDFAERVGAMHRNILATHPEALEKEIREIAAKEGRDPSMTREQVVRALRGDGVQWKVNKDFVTGMVMGNIEQTGSVIFDMRWRLLVAPRGHYFITSDSPAYWQDLTPRPPAFQGHGLAMPNVEVILPLSQKLCFLARWERSGGVMVATPKQVLEISNRTIQWSSREVFSPHPFKRASLDRWSIVKKRRGEKVLKSVPFPNS